MGAAVTSYFNRKKSQLRCESSNDGFFPNPLALFFHTHQKRSAFYRNGRILSRILARAFILLYDMTRSRTFIGTVVNVEYKSDIVFCSIPNMLKNVEKCLREREQLPLQIVLYFFVWLFSRTNSIDQHIWINFNNSFIHGDFGI